MKFSIEAFYNWYRDTLRNPKYRWWIILGSLFYLLSPLDISPDFLPIIGWIDDGVVATLLMAEVSSLLLDRLKASKTETATNTASEPQTREASTVDVDAVSVK